jgi:hypothetical protein
MLEVEHPGLVSVDVQLALGFLLIHEANQTCAVNAVGKTKRN